MENLDLIDVGIDDSIFVTEFDDTIEFAISDYVSILYNKSVKKFTVEWLDQETFDEYTMDIDEPFEDLELDGTVITKKDFEEFKELVLKSA
jgi:predicted DNA-binding protein with PD1-like motif